MIVVLFVVKYLVTVTPPNLSTWMGSCNKSVHRILESDRGFRIAMPPTWLIHYRVFFSAGGPWLNSFRHANRSQ